ncbi:MAG TPA: FecR family protein [Terriglobales bacterium]|nr:FecR family protein [Terriglobales bacterium]
MITRRIEIALLALSAFAFLTVSAFGDSQVRIVRLSEVDGNVQFDNAATQRYQKAFLNLPITQGAKLRSQSDGRAEVEFEDGSTLRVAPDTIVEFPQLSLLSSGGKISEIQLKQGTAYVNFSGTKNDQLTVTFGQEKLVLTHAAHVRLEVAQDNAAVAVFKGDVQVDGPSGAVDVKKNQTAMFDLADQDRHKLVKNLEEDPYDAWDKQQDQYHERYTASTYNSYSPYAYGTADLSYYGNFFNAPGYGMMWQPYFASAGWDPFMNGAWAFGPGLGYGWVSAYPWGWTPYHYGSWAFIPNRGWAWQPGSTWTGFNAVPRVVNAPANFVAPKAPVSGREMVVVNRGPAPVLQGKSANKLVIPNNSAGLGIPRGGIKDPAKVSQTVAQRGSITTKVQTAPVHLAYGNSGMMRSSPSPAAGPAPAAVYSAPSHASVPASSGAASHSGGGSVHR